MAANAALNTGLTEIVSKERVLSAARESVPWYIWCAALAVTSAVVGGHWDISWHSSIGRDTFWTPAHIAIYMCGVLAGIAFGYIILSTTFAKSSPLAANSVHIWGFRAPLGAFIASWGGIAMLTSAPFDNWWHDAYGLDVKIVSPPHILLFIGLYGVLIGTLVLIAAYSNRAMGKSQAVARGLFLYVCGIALVLTMVVIMQYTARVALHTTLPYILMAALSPIMSAVAWKATGRKYSATIVMGFYTLFLIGLILILPLFPAQPKLGPVYQHVTQFIPPEFPILLLVPAIAMDLLWMKFRNWNPWKLAAASGIVFVVLLLLADWPFASFLLSPLSRNKFFGTIYLNYGMPPTSYMARNEFLPMQPLSELIRGFGIAIVAAIFAIRWGFSRGEWMSKVKR